MNELLFHLMFNRLPTMNIQLVHGRKDILFGFVFDVEAFKKLPGQAVRVYIDDLANSLASLSGSFGFYRAWDTITTQNGTREHAADPARPGDRRDKGAAEGVALVMGKLLRPTCRAWSSPAAATSSLRRLPRGCWPR